MSFGKPGIQGRDERGHTSTGGRLVSADGRELVLRDATLRVDAAGGVARTVLEQRFASPYDEPLSLTYQLALPADGAVAGFAFRVGEVRVVGEIDRREAARQRFEEAILEGRTAALLDEERSSLFTQEIGNVPPRAEVVAEITVDQKLGWLAEGSWEWRFPTVVGPRYLGHEGRVPDAERVTVDVLEGAPPASLSLELSVRDELPALALPTSPSHPIRTGSEAGRCQVRLAAERGAALDRDLVVRWPVAASSVEPRLEVARGAAGSPNSDSSFGLLTIVPPRGPQAERARPRDLIVLLDASGSMHGAPFEHARRIAMRLVRSLGARDTLELIAFSSEPLRFRRRERLADEELRADALEWLAKLQAGGGTEMDRAIEAALAPLREAAQRHVVLITDGLIGFENEIVARVLRALPAGSRLHAVGVGSSVNRSLTAAAARAGRGVEVLVGIDEDADAAAERLLAHVAAPVVSEIEISGRVVRRRAPSRLRDLVAGAPVLVSLELDPAGGELEIRGDDGFRRVVHVPAAHAGTGSPALAALFAREQVEDLEMRAAAGEKVDRLIERIGLRFGIATRRTSWVSVSEEPNVDPRRPSRRVRIPQAVPYGASVEGFGLRNSSTPRAAVQWSMLGLVSGEEIFPSYRAYWHAPPSTPTRARALRHPARPARAVRPGILRPLDHGVFVVEFEVGDEPLRWDPASTATLFLEALPEEEVEVAVDVARSTAAGSIAPGLIVRLVLTIEGELAGVPAALEIETAGEPLRVALRA